MAASLRACLQEHSLRCLPRLQPGQHQHNKYHYNKAKIPYSCKILVFQTRLICVQISDSLIWDRNDKIEKCDGQTNGLTQWPFLWLLSQLKTNVSKIFFLKCEMWWSPSSRWWEGRSGHTGNTHASHAPVSWDYIVLHYIIIDYITL